MEKVNIDEINSKSQQEPGQIRSFGLTVKHPVFRSFISHPLVVAVWQHYLGQDCYCSSFSSNTILPHQGGMFWHVDHPYWTMKGEWPLCSLAGQTIWLLDDFNSDNGATAIIPYSHLKNAPPSTIEREAKNSEQITIQANAGSAILFDARLWHSTQPNLASVDRIALFCMYVRSFVIPMEAMIEQLHALENPTELEIQLMGGKQREPSRFFEAKYKNKSFGHTTDGLGNKI
ncbi:MAG: hypothetical protein A3F41_02380 [Coxiella sp. RIFCSPHIGHO2_12_FULL_44_14]|nr:MAG: hypothetical protein A3F41_02380 [Coxiella sp. RIFCSPHIGHO2_12_FULL_44_14]